MIYVTIYKIEGKYYAINTETSYNYLQIYNDTVISEIKETDADMLKKKYGTISGSPTETFAEDMVLLLTGCKAFKQKQTDALLTKGLDEYMDKFSSIDTYTWQIQEQEAKEYTNSGGKYSSEILTNIANLKGIEVSELVSKILEKANQHKTKIFAFKAYKDYINKKLNDLKTLEEFENFDTQKEINNYLEILENSKKEVVAKPSIAVKGKRDQFKPLAGSKYEEEGLQIKSGTSKRREE